ncbi:MAG: AAA family ATPase [Methylovirgula sp.]
MAIGDRNDIILYRYLQSIGVIEYFFKPLVLDLMKRTFNNVLSGAVDRPQSQRTGKLVFILGVRGGVGATTIAVNTAWSLAQKGQRWVMLVDFDLKTGDAALQLDVVPEHALREAFEKPDRVDKLFLERGTIHVGGRLDLLASLEPLDKYVPINEESALALLRQLQDRYRFVFIDLSATAALGLARMLQQPSTCILVSNGSLASARELARWREWIGPNSSERRTLHVLNMKGGAGELPEAEFIRAAGQPPDFTIPYDRDIAIASNLGVKATHKCAALNRGVAEVIRNLIGDAAAAPRSILSRIFGSR